MPVLGLVDALTLIHPTIRRHTQNEVHIEHYLIAVLLTYPRFHVLTHPIHCLFFDPVKHRFLNKNAGFGF